MRLFAVPTCAVTCWSVEACNDWIWPDSCEMLEAKFCIELTTDCWLIDEVGESCACSSAEKTLPSCVETELPSPGVPRKPFSCVKIVFCVSALDEAPPAESVCCVRY